MIYGKLKMPNVIKQLPKAVTTITPQRISFVGGGTDLPSFYSKHGGGVISTSINQYVYVTVKYHSPLFEEAYRLSYSKTEHANQLDEIENEIARECLRLVDIDPPLYISTSADLPASSGLGSSSSFAVGLLNALHHFKDQPVSPAQLAEEACEVEIKVLGHPIGKQDQYAAAFGGLNHIILKKNGRVEIDHLVLQNNLLDGIFKNSLLIWTGISRDATKILYNQTKNIKNKFNEYVSLNNDTKICKNLFLNPKTDFIRNFANILEKSWLTKRNLSEKITSNDLNHLHTSILSNGGLGGKLCGAGGGGFFFEIVPFDKQENIIKMYGKKRVLKVNYEPIGSRLLSKIY
jgi:D-glycero-alpha-D-manno-heptose-7-phosphate kinase